MHFYSYVHVINNLYGQTDAQMTCSCNNLNWCWLVSTLLHGVSLVNCRLVISWLTSLHNDWTRPIHVMWSII